MAPVYGSGRSNCKKLADETGLTIKVRHYPPGTSKWNKIEHRLFCRITQNWRGRPLTDHATIIELIGLGALDAVLVAPCVECALNLEPGLGRCRRDETSRHPRRRVPS